MEYIILRLSKYTSTHTHVRLLYNIFWVIVNLSIMWIVRKAASLLYVCCCCCWCCCKQASEQMTHQGRMNVQFMVLLVTLFLCLCGVSDVQRQFVSLCSSCFAFKYHQRLATTATATKSIRNKNKTHEKQNEYFHIECARINASATNDALTATLHYTRHTSHINTV